MQNQIPDAGDIIRLYVGPGKGNEQDGYRAVLVITDAEVNDKYLELATPVIGDATARQLLDALWSLEKLKNVDFDFTSRQRARAAG